MSTSHPRRCIQVEPGKEQTAQLLTSCADRMLVCLSAFLRHEEPPVALPRLEERCIFRRVIGQSYRGVVCDLRVRSFKECLEARKLLWVNARFLQQHRRPIRQAPRVLIQAPWLPAEERQESREQRGPPGFWAEFKSWRLFPVR